MITTIEQACLFLRKWLPPIAETDKFIIMEILHGTDRCGVKNPFINYYAELLHPYLSELGLSSTTLPGSNENECAASGVMFFYGCLLYVMHFPNWGQYIEDIFLYNMLYLLVDYYLDDIKVDV